MAQEIEFVNAIAELNATNQDITFAELIAKVWGGRIVEIYIGDTYEDIKYEDSATKYAAVLVGRVITAYAECIVLNCAYVDPQTKKMQFGNIVCLNERGIRTISEVDGSGLLKDTFLSSRDARIVKDLVKREQ